VIAAEMATGVLAFATPIVVFFTTVVIVSAFMITPGLTPLVFGAASAIIGLGGSCYLATTGTHTQWRRNQLPGVDWFWFVGLPILNPPPQAAKYAPKRGKISWRPSRSRHVGGDAIGLPATGR
jgi:hypothetical protein